MSEYVEAIKASARLVVSGEIRKRSLVLLAGNEHYFLHQNREFMSLLRQWTDERQVSHARSLQKTRELSPRLADAVFGVALHSVLPAELSALVKILFSPVVVERASGCRVTDIDGHEYIDIGNSYSVNILGNSGEVLAESAEDIRKNGYCLGPLTEALDAVTRQLCEASGLDMVSYYNSGTEAVMAALRSARLHSGRPWVVTFGTYHGWWDDVLANDLLRGAALGGGTVHNRSYYLEPYSKASLRAIARRANRIGAILIEARQGVQLQQNTTDVSFERERRWLHGVQELARKHDIPLILDEVVTGFRLGYRGARAHWDLDPDYVLYGKGVAGGMPVGVVCGRRSLLGKNYFNGEYDALDERPGMDDAEMLSRRGLYLAAGTFSRNPLTIASMTRTLAALKDHHAKGQYAVLNDRTARVVKAANSALSERGFKDVRLRHCGSVWAICHKKGMLFEMLIKAALTREGLLINAIGSGLCALSFAVTESDSEEISRRLERAFDRLATIRRFFPVASEA